MILIIILKEVGEGMQIGKDIFFGIDSAFWTEYLTLVTAGGSGCGLNINHWLCNLKIYVYCNRRDKHWGQDVQVNKKLPLKIVDTKIYRFVVCALYKITSSKKKP